MEIHINKRAYQIKSELYYNQIHQWIKINRHNSFPLITFGISDYAQKSLGEISFAELMSSSTSGKKVLQVRIEKDKPITKPIPDVTIESAKSVIEVHSPLSGVIRSSNQALVNNPELINHDPYGSGWLFTLIPSNLKSELSNLMTPESYIMYLRQILK